VLPGYISYAFKIRALIRINFKKTASAAHAYTLFALMEKLNRKTKVQVCDASKVEQVSEDGNKK
jgi:hypothetical protein